MYSKPSTRQKNNLQFVSGLVWFQFSTFVGVAKIEVNIYIYYQKTIYIYNHIYVYIYIHIYVCVCICINGGIPGKLC